jgi:hypothetical protein
MGMPKINAIKQHPQFPRRDLPGLRYPGSEVSGRFPATRTGL